MVCVHPETPGAVNRASVRGRDTISPTLPTPARQSTGQMDIHTPIYAVQFCNVRPHRKSRGRRSSKALSPYLTRYPTHCDGIHTTWHQEQNKQGQPSDYTFQSQEEEATQQKQHNSKPEPARLSPAPKVAHEIASTRSMAVGSDEGNGLRRRPGTVERGEEIARLPCVRTAINPEQQYRPQDSADYPNHGAQTGEVSQSSLHDFMQNLAQYWVHLLVHIG
jgi:hypothetical protein